MKKKISLMIALILVLQILLPMLTIIVESDFTIFSVAANVVGTWDISETDSDNVTATLYDDGKLVISGTGAMTNWGSSSNVPWYSNRGSITSVEIQQGVTSIGDYAFGHCTSLTSILIPYSVTSIGSSAFKYCSSLTSITVDGNNEKYCSKDGVLFNKDKTEIICYPAGKTETSYIIPEGVTSIGDYAFLNCSSLTSITIPTRVTSIGWMAFAECTSLTSITIPDSVTSIGDGAFYKCTSLTSVTIPEGVTSIRSNAFRSCSSLTSVTIPDSVTSIEMYAFYSCSSLTSVTIPDSVTSIGNEAFYNCSSLTSITVDGNNEKYCSKDGVLFNKDKTEIICYPAGKTETSYIIPDSVTSIGDRAFGCCSSLTSITIPDSVTSIGMEAFWHCSSLTSVTIPSSVTSMGNYTFGCCSSLTSVTISEGVTSIGSYAFEYCSSLTSVTIPDSVTSIGKNAFLNCSSLTSVTISDNVTSIGDYAFHGCSSLTSITVDENNEKYSSEDGVLFNKDKTKLIQYPARKTQTSYMIPNSVTSIEDYAFSSCISLTSITITSSVTSIGVDAFEFCTSLTSITIPDSVTSIGNGAFAFCTSLTSITIPSSVTSIGGSAFWSCSSLTITCESGSTAETYAKENSIKYVIEDIDRTAPVLTASYSTTEPTRGAVTVTITANEQVQKALGWTLSEDKLTLTKVYYMGNTTETVTVADIAGNEKDITIEINNIDRAAPTLTASYSTTEPTRGAVTVTITANEQLQSLTGWTLSSDKLKLTKTYTQNTTETVTVADLAGNTKDITIEINNIDKTAPTLSATQVISTQKDSCTVTITANEQVKGVTGWTLSSDKLKLTKAYTENKTETITVKDLAGNTKDITIQVSGIEKTFKINNYETEGTYIKEIQPETKCEDFIKNIETNQNYTIKEGENTITGTDTIKTGQKITVGSNSYTLIVTGDLNKDGKADIKDMLQINKYRLSKVELEEISLIAGDINKDGQVDFKDLLQINKFRLGKIDSL